MTKNSPDKPNTRKPERITPTKPDDSISVAVDYIFENLMGGTRKQTAAAAATIPPSQPCLNPKTTPLLSQAEIDELFGPELPENIDQLDSPEVIDDILMAIEEEESEQEKSAIETEQTAQQKSNAIFRRLQDGNEPTAEELEFLAQRHIENILNPALAARRSAEETAIHRGDLYTIEEASSSKSRYDALSRYIEKIHDRHLIPVFVEIMGLDDQEFLKILQQKHSSLLSNEDFYLALIRGGKIESAEFLLQHAGQSAPFPGDSFEEQKKSMVEKTTTQVLEAMKTLAPDGLDKPLARKSKAKVLHKQAKLFKEFFTDLPAPQQIEILAEYLHPLSLSMIPQQVEIYKGNLLIALLLKGKASLLRTQHVKDFFQSIASSIAFDDLQIIYQDLKSPNGKLMNLQAPHEIEEWLNNQGLAHLLAKHQKFMSGRNLY